MPKKNNAPCYLGIDPGTRRVGFGVVQKVGGDLHFVEAGLIAISATKNIEALSEMRQGLLALIQEHHPTAVGIEKLFFAKNQKTALQVAEARGVLLSTTHESGVPLHEFLPNEVKLNIAGYGGADKRAVQKMVRLILREPSLRVIDDASDALALAILAAGARLDERR